MNIEEDIFKKTIIDFNKLELYGFKKNNNKYIYSKTFYNSFRADITIDKKNKVSGKVYDLETNEEYTNIRLNLPQGRFINNIKESYKEILLDIKNKCTTNKYFISDQANRITKYIFDKYNDKPFFL